MRYTPMCNGGRKCRESLMSSHAIIGALLLLSAELFQLSTATSLTGLRPEARIPNREDYLDDTRTDATASTPTPNVANDTTTLTPTSFNDEVRSSRGLFSPKEDILKLILFFSFFLFLFLILDSFFYSFSSRELTSLVNCAQTQAKAL